MADIDLYQDDGEDTQGDDLGYLGSWIDSGDDSGLGGEDLEGFVPDDLLTPLQRMEKYMDSENIFSRQMVARSLMETIRAVGENIEDANAVLRNMVRLAEDSGTTAWESTIRADLMEQVPNVAMYCHENEHLFENPLPTFILPIITRYLVDSHNHVRKTSQAALLVLLEQELIERGDFELQVCPVILDLSSPDSIDDFRTEAVALMSKMAPLVGKEITVRTFMPRFADMCTDALFHVRKVCAANFGDMCTVVGQENVEKHLIDKFTYLCEDGVWGVRKACAECFMTVSCACSLEMRRNELAVVFINLICDQSRWVRMAAFQALGGFISTFADPINTGLYFNEEGILVAGNPDDFNSKLYARDFQGSDQAHEIISEILQQTSGIHLPSNTGDKSEKDKSETRAGDTAQQTSDNSLLESMDIDEVVIEETASNSSESSETTLMTDAAKPSLEEQRAEVYSQQSDRLSISSPGDTHISESSTDEKCDKDHSIDSIAQVDNESSRTLQKLNSNSRISDSSNSDSSPCDTSSSSSIAPVSNVDSHSQCISEPSPSTRPVHIHLENSSEEFNSFNYWRMPLPELDIDFDLVNGQPTNIHVSTRLKDEKEPRDLTPLANIEVRSDFGVASHTEQVVTDLGQIDIKEKDDVSPSEEEDDDMMHTASVSTVSHEVTPEETVTNIGSTHVLGQHVNETTMTIVNGVVQDVSNASLSYSPRESPDSEQPDHDQYGSDENLYLQNVIPQALLDHYLSMTDPSRAQTVDTDIARHCAYSLPAVAYTLGRRYWPCLKDLYETLAADMQWKVRRTLAFSIHDLAVIVGQEITTQDLVPIFNGFLKDLDEVRIGVLKHLADFLRLLKREHRCDYLDKIPDFLNTDNNRNWRFREELAAQLILLNELYTPYEVSEHLLPIALTLADDKVAEVRQMAFRGLACMVRRMSTSDKTLVVTFINDIIQRFAHSSKWNKRQIFAQCCQALLEEQSMNPQVFAQALMPSLLALGSDPIPNVRIALAKTISMHILHSEYFTSASNPHHEDLLRTVKSLQSDCDRDVRNFMNGPSESITEVDDMIPV